MRKEFIQCRTRKEAFEQAPWASYAMKVYGGYICYESLTDYEIDKNQK